MSKSRPQRWPEKRLRFVATINPLPPSRQTLSDDADVSFLPMEAIGEDGSLRRDACRLAADVRAGYSYFADGDVAFAKVTPCFENGKGAFMSGLAGGHGFGTTELTVLRPGPTLDARFLHYFLQSPRFRQPGAGSMTGAGGLKRVPEEFTRNICIPLPALRVQQSVANFLDRETARIDALIEKKTRFIELLREKRQALITQAVTRGLDPSVPMKDSGVAWIGRVPCEWVVCKLSFRYTVELGKMLDEKRITGAHTTPYLRNQDVQWGSINCDDLPAMDIAPAEWERYTVRFGDLLVCEGGDVGRAAIWMGESGKVGFQKALHRLRPRDTCGDSSDFMELVLMAAKWAGAFDEGDSRATISHLPAEKFRQYTFAFPTLVEQQAIATYTRSATTRLDQLAAKAIVSIALLRERRAALISAAVTGQIDMREAAKTGPRPTGRTSR